MPKLFAPNIDNKGRIFRGILGTVLLIGGLIAMFYLWWLGLILLVFAVFTLFEAIRGWCGLRACGIKTKF